MQVLRPCPNIFGFYDGRMDRARSYVEENWYDDGALELGICSYAIVEGDEAIVYDTHASIAHARFIRETLEREGVRRITVVLSHWHADHVAGNAVFADCEIVANTATRDLLEAHRDELERGLPPIAPLILPTTVFAGSRRLRVGGSSVELRQLDIHSSDGTVILLPDRNILLAGDTLEDPITYVVEPDRLATHLRDLERLRDWPIDAILPNHGSPNRIAAGGYDRRLVAATIDYIRGLLSLASAESSGENDMTELLAEHFASNAILYHPAYEQVHRRNKTSVRPSI